MMERGVDFVLGVRGLAQDLVDAAQAAGAQALFVTSPEEAGEWLVANLGPGDVVLLKASRGVRLEKALTVLAAART
jgi:UDP-N-acetylmuramoyl-tripeptide--D-alanyl-D-alanine ligase